MPQAQVNQSVVEIILDSSVNALVHQSVVEILMDPGTPMPPLPPPLTINLQGLSPIPFYATPIDSTGKSRIRIPFTRLT